MADQIVSIKAIQRLSISLAIYNILVPHKGHFLDSEGYTTFELLLRQITKL